ncbi:MAG TPA: GntR family transcriptional regulator [Clostridia bacterium]|nr:GntR family transcriptional regulator [Clostridia bacterium]
MDNDKSMEKSKDLLKNRKVKAPLYISVYGDILNMIKEGTFKNGAKLPGEYTLAKQLNVSRGTLRQALLLLQEDGLIYNRQGKGNFVTSSKAKIEEGLEGVFHAPLRFNIEKYDDILVNVDFRAATKKMQEILSMDSSKLLVLFEFTYRIKEQNVCYSTLFIRYDNIGGFEVDLNDKVKLMDFIHNYIENNISNILTNIRVVSVRDFIAKKLNVPPDDKLLCFDEIMYSNEGVAIIRAKSYFRTEYYEFFLNRK